MYFKKNIERNHSIYNDYFRSELSNKEIALKYGLSLQTIHNVIKEGQRNKGKKPPLKQIIFKGKIYKSVESLASKLGIKPESVKSAIYRGTIYDRRYKIQYYNKTA